MGRMASMDQFFRLVERFAEAKGITESTASVHLFNDGKRLRLLREGGDLGVRKMEDAIQYLSDHWPEGTGWPREIKRPDKAA